MVSSSEPSIHFHQCLADCRMVFLFFMLHRLLLSLLHSTCICFFHLFISHQSTITIVESNKWWYVGSVKKRENGVSGVTPSTMVAQWRANIILSKGRVYAASSSNLTHSSLPLFLALSRAVNPTYNNSKKRDGKGPPIGRHIHILSLPHLLNPASPRSLLMPQLSLCDLSSLRTSGDCVHGRPYGTTSK